MLQRLTGSIAAIAVGIGIAAGSYLLLLSNLSLAVGLGATYGLATKLFVRRWSLWGATGGLWGGVLGGGLTAVSLLIVPALPGLSDELAYAIGLLVIGTGAATTAIGGELVLGATVENSDQSGSRSDSTAD